MEAEIRILPRADTTHHPAPMSVTNEEVRYVARLARLEFSGAEEARLAGEMSRILGYMEQLGDLATDDVPPMTHVLDLHSVYRADAGEARITREDALRNAPDADDAFFRVPKVID